MSEIINKTAPNTFARYVENLKLRAQVFGHFILTRELGSDAEKFPCPPCIGRGHLIKESRYRSAISGSEFYKGQSAKEIRTTEYVICPCCCGAGVDQSAIDEAARKINQMGEVA